MNFTPTEEQRAIVEAFRSRRNLVVEAGAGAGKTSTLKQCAMAMPRARGTYIAYNRAIKEDAARSFPRSVRAVTSHGMAFRPVAVEYERAGKRINGPRVTSNRAAEILRINDKAEFHKDVAPLAPWQQARLALVAVDRFCKSGDQEIAAKHLPVLTGLAELGAVDAYTAVLLPVARRAWSDIVSKTGLLRFEHNHYLKIYQLSRPRLYGDYLLVDEAQDLNPCVQAIVAAQTHMQVVHVGDSQQAINGWNGAVDAMATADGVRLYLSQSFRFGAAVAAEANKWLSILNARLRLRGFDQICSTVGPLDTPDAVLCRTNAQAVREAIEANAAGRRAAIVGGTKEVRSLAEASIELRTSGCTSHPELMAFSSWAMVQDHVEHDAGGSDLKVAVDLIDTYGAEKIVEICDSMADERDADVTVSTAHKAKGREWKTVRIADDFHAPRDDEDGIPGAVPREDAMLAYVAVTRAQRRLDREGLAWVDRHLDGSAGYRPTIGELIEASSLGTPEAVALRDAAAGHNAASLTGMPEEQADWDSDDLAGCDKLTDGSLLSPVCLRCHHPHRECGCALGPIRAERSSGLTRDQFLNRVHTALACAQ